MQNPLFDRDIDGNTLNMPDTGWIRTRGSCDDEYNFVCPSCDLRGEHQCVVCGSELDKSECEKHEGLCTKHWTQADFIEKD